MPSKKKSQKRQRDMQIKTPCTLDEFNAIADKADAAGMTRAGYSRTVLLGTAGPRTQRRASIDRKALTQILGHCGRIGNNLNQIAKSLNIGQAAQLTELQEALHSYLDIRNAIYAALGIDPNPPRRDHR